MSLTVSQLFDPIEKGILGALGDVSEGKHFADSEAQKLAVDLVKIEQLHANGTLNNEQAKLFLGMQASNMRSAFMTAQGMDLLAAQQVVNAALNAVKIIVNAALNITLIP